MAIGWIAPTANTKIRVSVVSRIVRAISLGVFCRAAPSTSAIIRSMKVSPGLLVTLTTIRSESTVVPPVTAHRSPPDSRMTGADSPVIADSSTVATPSTTSPSPGMTWPASTTTRSPRRSSVPRTCSSVPSSRRRRAVVSVRVLRSVSAWALPRPSATASARLANSTVAQSQTVTETENTDGSSTASTVVSTEPTHTTKMTGERNVCRGSSLANAWGRASQPVRTRGAAVMTGPPRSARGRGPGRR